MTEPMIRIEDLKKHFGLRRGLIGFSQLAVRAVDGVTLGIDRGEVLGLVGESGSGKSTLGRAVMALDPPTSGKLIFDGTDLTTLSQKELKPFRRRMQMVFQDPFSSLNPRMTVQQTLTMPLRFNMPELDHSEQARRAGDMLERVGLPKAYLSRFPHEFSGGQRQRIGIARALMVEPDFLMADEAVSALDVSVQAQVLNLFTRIRREMDLTMLFITHDLSVVGHVSDRVAVMYLGQIMEVAPTRRLFSAPQHPYTEALLSAAPDPAQSGRSDRIVLEGDIPSPVNPPTGCPFRTRCRYALAQCAEARPEPRQRGDNHIVACIRDDLDLTPAIRDEQLKENA